MSTTIEHLKAYNLLRFCPVCGKELVIHPITLWKACFLHGDFIVTNITQVSPIIEWSYLS